MSWLSDIFSSGPKGPPSPDPASIEARRLAAEEEAKKAAELKKQEDLKRRGIASTTARSSASRYFQDLGLDPAAYGTDIDLGIEEALGSVAEDDPAPGQYLSGLGEQIFNNKQNALRTRSGRDVDMLFQPEFERSRIADTADDDILAQINTAERGQADEFINNLFKRGVITEAGRGGAARNLDDQGSRVRGILDEIGSSVLAGGRQNLTDIANRGRQTAQTLKLGQSFDPSTYAGQADTASTDFFGKLGDTIKGRVTDDLYDTSGLAAIAGAAQGAGNTKFDPNALAGVLPGEEEEDDPTNPRRVTF